MSESFFGPAFRLLRDHSRHRRDTPEFSDEQFLRGGLQRVLGHCDSGRDFLQQRQDRGEALARATWFDALHPRRRAAMVAEVATRSYELFDRFLQLRDWLGAFPELAGRAVWAVDGHHLDYACHAAQLICQFIRLLRHCLVYNTSWREAMPLFERRVGAYL